MVRYRGPARLALRQPRQRGLGADREAGAGRFPADPRRRLQPSVQPALGIPRRQRAGAVLPARRDRAAPSRIRPPRRSLETSSTTSPTWRPAASRKARLRRRPGRPAPSGVLGHSGASYEGGKLSPRPGPGRRPGGGRKLAGNTPAIADFLKAGGHLLAFGLDATEANAFLPLQVGMKKAEHIAACFEPPAETACLRASEPADVHNRAPRKLPLVSAGATVLGDGVLARAQDANVVFCQLPPYSVARSAGAVPSFVVNGDDAADGKQSALLTLGTATESGMQLGQKVKAGEIGKTYTFAVFVKPLCASVPVHLEIERPSSPWDRAVKGEKTLLAADEWTDLHVTFRVEKSFPQGWFASIVGGQQARG